MNNTKVIIGFPEITEIRIGTAIRVAILSYVKYNDRYDNIVPYEKLLYVLKNVKKAYRFRTVKNYSEYVLSFFLGEKYNIDFNSGNNFDKINKEFGSKKIPLETFLYLNNVVLPKIVKVALKNLSEDVAIPKVVVLKSREFLGFYQDLGSDEEIIKAFCEDLIYYLEYNQIIHIPNIIVAKENKNVLLPIKFSFIDNL